MQQTQAKQIITVKRIAHLGIGHLPLRPLPKNLTQAAGLLKGKLKKSPLAYQKSVRREW